MRILAIDTSTSRAGLALLEDDCPVAERTVDTAGGGHAEKLVGLIDDLVRGAGWSPVTIELVACGTGPGSFTGVRVALATAKGIALALGRPIIGVSSLASMAFAYGALSRSGRAPCPAASEPAASEPAASEPAASEPAASEPAASETVIALLDAKKNEIFAQSFRVSHGHEGLSLEPVGEPGHFPRDAASSLIGVGSPVVVIGSVAADLSLGAARRFAHPATDLPHPVFLGRLGLALWRERGPDLLEGLEPAYVRPPDAVPNERLVPAGGPPGASAAVDCAVAGGGVPNHASGQSS